MTSATPVLHHGIVKQILSGDSIIIRGQPKGGPPPERTLCLTNVVAPRLARRPNPNLEHTVDVKDEPFAWEVREFLRKKLVAKEVTFTVEYKQPATGREYGYVYLGKDTESENITESLVCEGLVEVRKQGIRQDDTIGQRLLQLEEAAKAAGKGRYAEDASNSHVRSITWTLENPRMFVDSHHNKPIDAVIEHVRDGCTVRAFLLPSFQYVTVMLSGIKAPMFKLEGDQQVPEPFAEEAKFFTEARLLQRDVQIILEGISNQNLLGTVLHPNGNVAELLLREGFARCVDWSMGVVTQGSEKLRAAEKIAKDKRLRLWKNYTPPSAGVEVKDKAFTAKVIEVVNADGLSVKLSDGEVKKIFLASIRPPRLPQDAGETDNKKDPRARARPLYDIPYMFEAREFLRKKLTGKKVNVTVDYIQPASVEANFPAKTCCTVTIGGINVAEALISKGFATVIRYRQDDDQRSKHYDELLAAESRAIKKAVGLHSKKEVPIHRVADISGDVPKAKQFLPFLQRAGKMEALVEFIASGSRMRIYIPRETCLITFLLSGIDCPRAARPGPAGTSIPSEPFGDEALAYSKEQCLQREVEVEVEAMDKGGNFIGYMHVDGVNMSVALVEEGLAKVHFTAERSNYYKALLTAEERAKTKKLRVWSTYEEPKKVDIVEEPKERKVNYSTVLVTEVTDDYQFYVQNVDNGPQLEKLMEQLRQDLESNPPLPGAYIPKKGDICAAKFVDGEWYRGKVEKVEKNGVHVLYMDYGNKEVTSSTQLATLPATYHTLPPQASLHAFACIALPQDVEAKQDAVDALYNDILNKQFQMNVEYRSGSVEYVTMQDSDTKEDIGQSQVLAGLVLAEARKEKWLSKLVADYTRSQEKAKNARVNLWRYGDFQEDDAKEFGYKA